MPSPMPERPARQGLTGTWMARWGERAYALLERPDDAVPSAQDRAASGATSPSAPQGAAAA